MSSAERTPVTEGMAAQNARPFEIAENPTSQEAAASLEPTHVIVGRLLLEKGASEHVAGVTSAKFEYGRDGEPPKNMQVAGQFGFGERKVRKLIEQGIATLEGDEVFESLSDPYLDAYRKYIEDGGVGRMRSRKSVLSVAAGASAIGNVVKITQHDPGRRIVASRGSKSRHFALGGGEVTATDPVRMYMQSAENVSLLTREQEIELAKQIEAGVLAQEKLDNPGEEVVLGQKLVRELKALAQSGQEAKDHMVAANLRLVVKYASRRTKDGYPLLDAIQEGNLGLVKAVEQFDYRRGFRFSTFAVWPIRKAIATGEAKNLPNNADDIDDRMAHGVVSELNGGNVSERVSSAEDMALYGAGGSEQLAQMREAMLGLDPLERQMIAMKFGLGDGKRASGQELAEAFGFETAIQANTKIGWAITKLRRAMGVKRA